jgi:hypothetical protein
MKAPCHPYWSSLKGFYSVQVGWSSPCFLITIPICLLLWDLLGLKRLVSLCIVSLGYGFVHAIDGCAVGYIASPRLYFILALLVG